MVGKICNLRPSNNDFCLFSVTMTKIIVYLLKEIVDESPGVSVGQVFNAKCVLKYLEVIRIFSPMINGFISYFRVETIRQFYAVVKFGNSYGTVHVTEIVDEIEVCRKKEFNANKVIVRSLCVLVLINFL